MPHASDAGAPLRTTPLMCDFAPIIFSTDSRERPCALV
jgi:hypothetical protein